MKPKKFQDNFPGGLMGGSGVALMLLLSLSLFAGKEMAIGVESWLAEATAETRLQWVEIYAHAGTERLLAPGPGILYSDVGLKSTDYGETWTDPWPSFTEKNRGKTLRGMAISGQTIWLSDGSLSPDGLLKSEDDGRSFKPVGGKGCTAIAIHPQKPDTVIVNTGNGGPIRRTEDGGETWRNIFTEPITWVGRIAYDPQDPRIIWISATGSVFKSSDNGENWVKSNMDFYDISINPSKGNVVLGVGEAGTYLTTDGGIRWKQVLKPQGGMMSAVAFAPGNPQVAYCGAGNGDVYRSDDGGMTWKNWGQPPHSQLRNTYIWAIAVDPENEDICYVKSGIYIDRIGLPPTQK